MQVSIKSDFSALNKLSENLKNIEAEQTVPLTDILTDSFIQKKTPFLNLTDLFDKAGFKVETNEDLEAIPDEIIDKFIQANSEYKSFQEMLGSAGKEYMSNIIFKGLK